MASIVRSARQPLRLTGCTMTPLLRATLQREPHRVQVSWAVLFLKLIFDGLLPIVII